MKANRLAALIVIRVVVCSEFLAIGFFTIPNSGECENSCWFNQNLQLLKICHRFQNQRFKTSSFFIVLFASNLAGQAEVQPAKIALLPAIVTTVTAAARATCQTRPAHNLARVQAVQQPPSDDMADKLRQREQVVANTQPLFHPVDAKRVLDDALSLISELINAALALSVQELKERNDEQKKDIDELRKSDDEKKKNIGELMKSNHDLKKDVSKLFKLAPPGILNKTPSCMPTQLSSS